MKKILGLVAILILMHSSVYAAPAPASVNTGLVHGSPVTISGIGFGAKSPVAPLFWNDLESMPVDQYTSDTVKSSLNSTGVGSAVHDVESIMATYANLNLYGDPRITAKDSNSTRWIASPHSKSTKILGGGWTDTLAQYGVGALWQSRLIVQICAAVVKKTWYAHYYSRVSPDWVWGVNTSEQTIPNFTDLTLAADMTDSQGTLTIAGAHHVKLVPNDVLLIDSEKVLITGKTGTTVNITREYGGTTRASHTSGTSTILRGHVTQWNLKTASMDTGITAPYSSSAFFEGSGDLFGLNHAGQVSWYPCGDGGGLSRCTGCNPPDDYEVYSTQPSMIAEWKAVEFMLQDDPPGWAKTYVNNKNAFDCSCTDTGVGVVQAGYDIGCYGLGYYSPRMWCPLNTGSCSSAGNNRYQDENWLYWDDIYVDNTFSRVMLCNNATYTSSTICEPQIPQNTWNATSIEVKVNQGALPNGTAYLFVFDSTNVANATGVAVTLRTGVPSAQGCTISGGTFR